MFCRRLCLGFRQKYMRIRISGNSQRLRDRRDFSFLSDEYHRDGPVVFYRRCNRKNGAGVRFLDFGDDAGKALSAE